MVRPSAARAGDLATLHPSSISASFANNHSVDISALGNAGWLPVRGPAPLLERSLAVEMLEARLARAPA